jgi:DNA-binding SARP family transcriptional activator
MYVTTADAAPPPPDGPWVHEETPEDNVHPHHHHHHLQVTTIERTPAHVEIRLLGGFSVTVDGVTSPAHRWNRRSAAALVKVLALAPDHRLHREKVMDLLWPDESPIDCAPKLHKAAYFARRATGSDDAIVLRGEVVHLFPGATLTVDTVEFERLAKHAIADRDPQAARAALGWYRGELLPADRYDDWAHDRRELLHLRRLDVLRAAAEWRELTEAEPTDEEAHVRLMHAHIEAGDRGAALRQYEHLAHVLERDLGATPGPAARRARLDASALRVSPTATNTHDHLRAVLAELTQLMSRQDILLAELAELAAAGAATPALVA